MKRGHARDSIVEAVNQDGAMRSLRPTMLPSWGGAFARCAGALLCRPNCPRRHRFSLGEAEQPCRIVRQNELAGRGIRRPFAELIVQLDRADAIVEGQMRKVAAPDQLL